MDTFLEGFVTYLGNQEQRDAETVITLAGMTEEYNHQRGMRLLGDLGPSAMSWKASMLRRGYWETGTLSEDDALALIAAEKTLGNITEVHAYAEDIIRHAMETR